MSDENHAESRWHSPPIWQRIAFLTFVTFLALSVAGCSANDSSDEASERTTESACDQAFAEAASVSEMQDTVEDLYPAIRVCTTIGEWTAASDAHPDALDGADPVVFLTNACLYASVSDVKQTELCRSLG